MTVLRRHSADFEQLLKVLRREKTDRPVLFEIYFDPEYYSFFAGRSLEEAESNSLDALRIRVEGSYNAGLDFATDNGSEFRFPLNMQRHEKTVSLNESCMISDWESFSAYPWMDPDKCCYDRLEQIKPYLPDNMKLVILGPGGVLENVTQLIGYENMCFMLYEDPELLEAVFTRVGSGLLRYYERVLEYDTVGAIISADDWGFNTQTFLSVPHLRKYVFPWHRKIVEAAHKKGKPAILHSCGYMNEVFEDIIEYMQYDAKHSFEDNILPVEKCYERWGDRIAILGGIDMDFLISSSMDEVRQRCRKLADLAVHSTGYALGTGNSLCYYVPKEKAIAMMEIANNYGFRQEKGL